MKRRFISLTLVAITLALNFTGCQRAPEEITMESTEKETIKTEKVTIDKSELGNPILGFNDKGKLTYGGDPAALVDGDTVYLYTGHDTATNESYVIPEWQCYSTKDMINWTYEGVVLKAGAISWADRNSAWAGQVTKHYDKESGKDMYYFYTCSWSNKDNGKQSIGVAVSESPTGPFTDIGHELVKGSFTTDETSTWNDIDPTVWFETDENGEEHRYLAWGNSKLYVCELNEDMTSVKDLDGDGQIVFGKDVLSKKAPEEFTEAPWIYRRQDENGNYYGDYYLFYAYGWREQMAYATTDDLIYGDYEFQGVIMKPTATSNTNHMSVIDFKGETYFIYHNGTLKRGSGYRRVACVEKLVFNEDGSVPYIEETATGISGKKYTITALNGDVVCHEHYTNSSDDGKYPYTSVDVGSGLKNTVEADTWWEIVPGKLDTKNESYVSIEAYNKPGLYFTGATKAIKLSQDHTGSMSTTQTFKTVKGLAGDGVSFESLNQPGRFITLVSGKLILTDGSDPVACSFKIEEVKE